MVSTPGSRSGRWADGSGLIAMPMTPPAEAKALSAEEKREITHTDHFQVGHRVLASTAVTVAPCWQRLCGQHALYWYVRTTTRVTAALS